MTSVTISESAARRIGEILKSEPDGAMLRVSVEGGGCSGFQYKFDIERAKAEDDLVLTREIAPEMRRSIECVKLEGLSVVEAAVRCGISESAVKVNVHRGLKALAAAIAREKKA